MSVSYRRLGSTDFTISAVGLGTWTIGRDGPNDEADEKARTAILRAVEHGVNWIDTAGVYGLGHAETIVGSTIKTLPEGDRPIVVTKCGISWSRSRAGVELTRSLHPVAVRRDCEASLRRLSIEPLDMLLAHWPDETGVNLEDSWAALVDLRASGKVRSIGLSNFSVDETARAHADTTVDAVEPRLSLISREALAGLIPWCRANGVGVIAHSPLEGGLLTGKYQDAVPDSRDDWRRSWPEFLGERLRRNRALVKQLMAIASEAGTDVCTLAISWAAGRPGVSGVIAGARDAGQVDGWSSALSTKLDATIERAVEAALEAAAQRARD